MYEQRLIDANLLAECFKMVAERIGSEHGVFYGLMVANIGKMLEDGTLGSTVDAVPREEHESLVRRFKHLLESDYIRSFDEVVPFTGKYKRDIREADRERPHGHWVGYWNGCHAVDQMHCTKCRCEIRYTDGFKDGKPNYCPRCGADMRKVTEG